jgi:Flp pilus assembly secretin CpaC
MVLNNQEAKIHVGVKDAYITSTTSQSGTGTAVTSQSVNFVDTGIQLYVTPTINRDGFVTMKIKPEISDSVRTNITSEGQITQIPIVSTSEAETTVMVKDGVTIIIGGLRKDKREKTVRKIPLLGDIPGIGFLFRSTSDSLTKSDLVILLTPHIISGEHTYSDFSEIKPNTGAVAKMVDGNIITEKISGSPAVGAVSTAGKIDDIREYRKVVMNKLNAMIAKLGHADSAKGTVEVIFVIDAHGQLREEPRIISASNEGLVDATRAYIKQAAPFPPLPKDWQKPEESFHLVLEYK